MERNNKEAASPLRVKDQVGKLYGSVDHGAWTWYERVKGTPYSASIGMKTVLSNFLNENIHEWIEANEGHKFGSGGGNKSEDEKASKDQEGREINQNSWISNDKTKSGDYVLKYPRKKPGGEEHVGFGCTIRSVQTNPVG